MKAKYRSSRTDEIYFAEYAKTGSEEHGWMTLTACTCPSYLNRKTCGHVEQLQRMVEWNQPAPGYNDILDPPPPAGSWQKEVTDGT